MPDNPSSSSTAAAGPEPTSARPRWLWAAIALVVLALAAGVVYVVTDPDGEPVGGASPSVSEPSSSSSPTTSSTSSDEPTSGPSAVDALWERKDQLQTPRDDFGTVVIDDKIWVVGGMTGERGNKLATTETYDPAADLWSLGPPMPTARSSLAAVELDGTIYAMGGSSDAEPYLDVVEALDTATGEWTRLAPMPTGRYEFGAVVLDGKIWAIGGSEDNGTTTAGPSATVSIFDPATGAWSAGPSLALARSSLRTAVLDGKIYAVGGLAADGLHAEVEIYDPAVGTWQPGPPLPEPLVNFGFGTYDGELHAIYHEFHFVLAPGDTEWRVQPTPSILRHGLGVVEVDGQMYAIGGCTKEPLADVNTVQVWLG